VKLALANKSTENDNSIQANITTQQVNIIVAI